MRRAAISVPSNISEGSARKSSKEFLYFLRISFGRLNETETLLIIALGLKYLKDDEFENLHKQIRLITVQLSRLINSISNKIK
jgi:four helix bundle protein